MNAVEIKNMSTVERLQVMEAIWDSLIHDEEEIESPDWHGDILKERKIRISEGKTVFISIKDLKNEINK